MQLKTTMTHVGQWWPNATDDRRQTQAPDARNSMLITSFRSRESQDQDADCRPGDISSASRLKLGGGDGASAISNLKSRHPPRCLPAYPRSAARIGSGRLSAPYPLLVQLAPLTSSFSASNPLSTAPSCSRCSPTPLPALIAQDSVTPCHRHHRGARALALARQTSIATTANPSSSQLRTVVASTKRANINR